jgi:hypothetical protein
MHTGYTPGYHQAASRASPDDHEAKAGSRMQNAAKQPVEKNLLLQEPA